MKNALKTLLVMTLAVACGFATVHAIFRGPRLLAAKTKPMSVLTLEVEARDTRGRPLAHADVTLFSPKATKLGRTDERGLFRGRLTVPAGQVHAVELSGRDFRVRKDLRVANLAHMESRLVFALGKKGLASIARSGAKSRRALAREEKGRAPSAPTPSSLVPVQVFYGPQSDRAFVSAIASRLRVAVERNRTRLQASGVARLQLRQLWNEASYVEIVAVAEDGRGVGGYLLRSQKTDAAWLDFALTNMWNRDFTARGHGRTLTVVTGRPGEARAYLNGIPLPRRVQQGKAVFDLSSHPAARAQSAILTLTSDDGPLIRSAVSVASLARDIRWSLPETALSRR